MRLRNLTGHSHDMSALLTLGTKISLGWSDYKSAALNAGVNPPKTDAVESSEHSGFTFRGFSVGEACKHKHTPHFVTVKNWWGGCKQTIFVIYQTNLFRNVIVLCFFPADGLLSQKTETNQKEKHNSSRSLAWLVSQSHSSQTSAKYLANINSNLHLDGKLAELNLCYA